MTPAQYAQAVNAEFQAITGRQRLLTPEEVSIVRRWQRRGIPCYLAMRGLRDGLASVPPGEAVHSLKRLAHGVKALWQQVRELSAGRAGHPVEAEEPTPGEEARLRQHLNVLADSLPAELPDRERFQRRLWELPVDREGLFSDLFELEEEATEAALEAMGPGELEAIDARIAGALLALGRRLPLDQLARHRDQLRQQVVRERLSLDFTEGI